MVTNMDLGLNLGSLVGREDVQGQLALARRAEELGYRSVWAAEAYGSDSPTVLAWLAGQTSTIDIGSAVMQIPGRTPAMTAMTAASLDVLSGGRFRLGLGVSGPQVSEGWHGVRFDQPLGRTRDYVEIVRSALRRETVSHHGEHYPMPLPDGPGKALKLTVQPVRPDLPIYLAAVGPRNIELAGEIADGWLGILVSPDYLGDQLDHVRAGRARADASSADLADFDVVANMPVVVGQDAEACARSVRGYVALYVGGMGSRKQNFYHALAVRMGFGAAATQIQNLFLTGRQRDAAAAVPVDLIDSVSLLGQQDRIADKLARLGDAGVTTCSVTPFGRSLEEKLAALETVANAHSQTR